MAERRPTFRFVLLALQVLTGTILAIAVFLSGRIYGGCPNYIFCLNSESIYLLHADPWIIVALVASIGMLFRSFKEMLTLAVLAPIRPRGIESIAVPPEFASNPIQYRGTGDYQEFRDFLLNRWLDQSSEAG